MKIQSDYNNYGLNKYKNSYVTINKDIAFEGLNLGKIFSSSKSGAISEKVCRNIASEVGMYIGLKSEEVVPRVKGLNKDSIEFLRFLSKKYSDINFYLKGNLRDDPELVFKVLDAVPKPKDYHYSVVSRLSGSFEYISKVLSVAKDKKSLKFAESFQQKIFYNGDGKMLLIDMLNSPHKKQYIDDIENFRSYLLLNRDNPEAIKELDLLISSNSYDSKLYDIKLAVKKILNYSRVRSSKVFTQDNIEKHYTRYGNEFLDRFFSGYYYIRPFKLSHQSEIDVLSMFSSTTKENVQLRNAIITKFSYVYDKNPKETEKEISAMKDLFGLVDSDKHARSFVNKVLEYDNVNINSVQDLYEILSVLTPQKADIFSDNIIRILRKTNREELIPTLEKNYNNPFFETKSSKYNREQMIRYGYMTPESRFSKFKRLLQNKLNEFRYAHSENRTIKPVQNIEAKPINSEQTKPLSNVTEQPVVKEQIIKQSITEQQPHKPEEETIKPVINENSQKRIQSKPFEWNTQKALPLQPERKALPQPKRSVKIELPPIDDLIRTQKPNEVPIKLEHIITDKKEDKPVIKIVNTVKESPKARKLRIKGEVHELISKKLGAKTIEKQGEIFEQNATAMRLKLLPEIFESIRETRQTDRVVGKLKSASANKDAVELYRLINGNNRKYVKYLLEKRNVDGTRMFEVKDIISMIEKANKKVATMKKSNPDFKAKDAKAYFDHLYDAKIEQYGKVKRTKKK